VREICKVKDNQLSQEREGEIAKMREKERWFICKYWKIEIMLKLKLIRLLIISGWKGNLKS